MMIASYDNRHLRIGRRWAAVAVALFLTFGCAPPQGTEEPADRFPVRAERVTFAVALGFIEVGGTARAENETAFRKFTKEFLRRGRGPLVVAASPALEPALLARLHSEGIASGAIVMHPDKAPDMNKPGAVLSFRGYMVTVPECGNWKGETGFNPSNLPHPNYGCSYHRNMGLMLADPGDLVAPEGVVEFDARRMDNVIRVFREGTPAGADAPKSEKGKFASPSQEQ